MTAVISDFLGIVRQTLRAHDVQIRSIRSTGLEDGRGRLVQRLLGRCQSLSFNLIRFDTTVCISTDSECNMHRDITVQDNSGRIRCDVLILR